ncbi:DUF4123 domain-containing protein [Enterovibrio norvegicus]|uniref:DUF4123 domain-containing protein n=1 Tax=Enterovibrio norvegicus DSM 15893 TaxID=1121869 RepID=A0A1I5NJ30_9GAMM|nr:DUF4123 domain-containing protein [Enterovibrio norvegicus]SFP21769.1 protein of unknown function [Enterovibrio norvegicus DSM 15893]
MTPHEQLREQLLNACLINNDQDSHDSTVRLRIFALLDPSHNEQLIAAVQGMSSSHRCLFEGEDYDEFEEESPWIATLNPEEPLLDWLLQETFGQQQAIYIVSHEGIDALFTAFQRMKEIVEPSGELIYFRFYDGSTLNRYLPVLSEGQRREFFSSVTTLFAEEGENGFFQYSLNHDASLYWAAHGEIKEAGIYPLPGIQTEEYDPELPWFFSEEQLQFPLLTHRDELIDDLIEYLEYEEIDSIHFYPKGFLRAMINQGIEHCFHYSILDLAHIRLFINIMWTINPQFHLQPIIHHVLSESVPTETKFDTLLSDEFEETWVRAGAEKYSEWWPEEGATQ